MPAIPTQPPSAAVRRRGGAAAGDRGAQLSVLRRGRADRQRCRVRRAVPRAAGAGARASVAGDAGLADAAGGRRAGNLVRERHPPGADALAQQRVRRRRGGGVRPPRPRGPRRRRRRVRGRAQVRRPRHQPRLRGRAVHRGRDARRRQQRRERHCQPAHGRRDPAEARRRRAAAARGARRGADAQARLRGAERGAGGQGREDLRQSAQRGRRFAAPARPQDHGRPAPAPFSPTAWAASTGLSRRRRRPRTTR